MSLKIHAVCLGLVLAITSTVAAQGTATPAKTKKATAYYLVDDVQYFPTGAETPGADPTTAVDPEKAAALSAEAKKTALQAKRLAKIKALKFDRRTSVILKAWSTPYKTLAELAEEKKKAAAKKNDNQPPEPPATTPTQEPAAEPDPSIAQLKELDEALRRLQHDVTLGDWGGVKGLLESLEAAEQEALYKQLLTSLLSPPRSVPSNLIRFAENNSFSLDDVMALIELTPQPLNKTTNVALGNIVRLSLSTGNSLNDLVEKLKELTSRPVPPETKPEDIRFDKRKIAEIMMNAGQTIRAGDFLPDPDEAIEQSDRESLNLLSRYFLAMHAKEKETPLLEKAWKVTQAALAAGDVTEAQKQEALKRAVELAPKIKEELGQAWLDDSFTTRPERGMEILATIGSAVSTGLVSKSANPTQRQKELELQNTAVQALLKASPERAVEWKKTLNLLAINWLKEAEHSRVYDGSSSRGPALTRDVYGNYFYSNYSYRGSSGGSGSGPSTRTPQAVASGQLLDIKPDASWLKYVDKPLQPRFVTILPQLHLKVNEEDKAFPYIESLAKTNPEIAKDLAEEFLRVWTKNHDPNSSRRRTSVYMFSYGFNRRAQGIPLTRSKQVRNMKELSAWVGRIRELPIGDIDESVLTSAFTNTHGAAEVYQLEDIEAVFGSLENLKPATLASLIQKMRSNLSNVWRMPATQKNAGTNRKKKDIEVEVRRGYLVANSVLNEAIKAHPLAWELHLAKAAVKHDENNYHQELEQSAEYISKRQHSMDAFKESAEMYAKKVEALPSDKWSAQVFENWFYASLGDSDLGKLKKDKQADLKQMPIIREAILALPGETVDKHMGLFANSLFTRLSGVNAGVKFRYLRAGFEIVGDHKRAEEARKVFEYYKDLVTEIKLETQIDGNDNVGQEPFGLFVNLRHTGAIERESGGFSRYLKNQNNNRYFSYNYGRPTENYRDKFEESVTEALKEQFEVQSVTFQREDVNSRATEQAGWRVTPYAYVLLKARGPEVDKIPAVQLDLDFLDTSGYAVIPVESADVPIDASNTKGDARPLNKLTVTQTLDERQSKDRTLILEIKGTAQGLVPSLDDLLDVDPKDFEIIDVQDEGVAVSQFDKEAEDNVIVSERNWLVTLEAKKGLAEFPKSFEFAKSKLDTEEFVYQRYVDADLSAVESIVSLEEQYGDPASSLWWWIGGLVLIAIAVGVSVALNPKKEQAVARANFVIPSELTPFTVLGLLKNIQSTNGLNTSGHDELSTTINRVEEFYFFDQGNEPDLNGIAREWVDRAC